MTPGATIWLGGGTYADGPVAGGYVSQLTGTAAAPIVVRQFPGERATVTNFLGVQGGYTWYWGFEVVNTVQQAGSELFGIDDQAPGAKFINLVVHDATGSGIFIWPQGTDAEVYGSISYNNGRTDNLDHGIYCQSQSSTLLEDNIVFDNWAFGIHCFAKVGPYLQNIAIEGNVAFNDYVWGVSSDADMFVGGHFPASGIVIDQNYTYRSNDANTKAADVGYNLVVNHDVVLTNNYFVGGWARIGSWATALVTGNTLFNFAHSGLLWNLGDVSGQTWSGNTFFGDSTALAWRHDTSATIAFAGWRALTGLVDPGTYGGTAPSGIKIVVRPNRYEPGRANIIVYNWAQQSAVSVDVSGILDMGDRYVVQNVQDFYGPPAASGTYTGKPLELPMLGVTAPTPLGVVTAQAAPVTGPTFNVFVLMRTRHGRCHPGRPEVHEGGEVESCGPPHPLFSPLRR
ncbi:MAG TPA: right-handed parallel beta-helix repeat-containing protein [Gemmatimonadales bacterium]|nr:right-handed parallel beta-helix repeat-containing protein [Gemmatimonadales bacterium]